MNNKRYLTTILILGSLTALGPFSIDMYLPGFPAIARSFGISVEKVALSLSSFFIGISAGQLLYGPLLDRFGRKRPLYFGLCLYITASIGCFYAADINILITLRFVQAIGACAASVTSFAMVRDLFPVRDSARVFALLVLVLGASPLLAPTLGGYVTAAAGWRPVFLILALMALIELMTVFAFLPESYSPDPSVSLTPASILSAFRQVLRNPQFYTYSLCGAFAFAGLFAYVASSPVVFMQVYKVSAQTYGWIFAALAVGLVGSSQLNNVLTKKYSSERTVQVSLLSMVGIAGAFFTGTALGWIGITGCLVMIFGILCCIGLMFPNTTAMALAPFTNNAGVASSLTGAFQMAVGSLISVILSLFKATSAFPMAVAIFLASVIALAILFIGKKRITKATA